MRTLVILNPAAGGGVRAPGVGARIASRLEAELRVTEGPGHAAELAAAASREGVERVVAVGGDGTVGEVADGLWGAGGGDAVRSTPALPRLGIVPLGTGNDLARALGIPIDVEAAAEVVRRDRSAPLDLIEATAATDRASRRIVTNAIVAGFCGRIGDRMSPRFRHRWGRLAYLVAALREVADLRSHAVRVRADGVTLETRACMVVLANGRYVGGRIPLAPEARTDDGALDLVILEATSLLPVLRLVAPVLRGGHLGRADVRHVRAVRVDVAADPPMWMNADGETWQAGAVSLRVIPAALRVLVP